MTPVLETHDLAVTYRLPGKSRVEALCGVNLSLPPGSVLALLGPNGAGKTTLMRCMIGGVLPTDGRVFLFGKALRQGAIGGERAFLGRIGLVPEAAGAYSRLDAREYLAFFAGFYDIPDPAGRIQELCRLLGLELSAKPVGKMSQGQRQRLQLARSLLHRPELLLWDEPTEHLDPLAQAEILDFLRNYLHDSGATLLLASHRLDQVEMLATHFAFLRQGRLAFFGNRFDVLGLADGEIRLEVEFLDEADLAAVQETVLPLGLQMESLDRLREPLARSGVRCQGKELARTAPLAVKRLSAAGHAVCRVELRRPALAEIYARLMGEGA